MHKGFIKVKGSILDSLSPVHSLFLINPDVKSYLAELGMCITSENIGIGLDHNALKLQ